jgi:hypothetical protein
VPTVLFGQSSPSALPFLRDLPVSPPTAGLPSGHGGSPFSPGGTSPSHGAAPASPSGSAAPEGSPTPGASPSHGGAPAPPSGSAPGNPGSPATPGHSPWIRWGKGGFPAQPQRSGRTTMIAIAAGAAAAIVIAAGGIAATVHNGPFGIPGTAVTLDAVVLTQSATPPVNPSSAAPPPSRSTGTPALAFTATGTAHCVGASAYTLKVTVTANATLATATLHWPGPSPMGVSGKTAQLTVTGVASAPNLFWHVDIRAVDGRTLTGPNQSTANPC